MHYFIYLIFSLVLLIPTHSIIAQDYLHVQGLEIVDGNDNPVLLRGMGLGGWMLQEGYMMQTASFANAQYQIREKIEEVIGVSATNTFYDAWLENYVQKRDVDSMKAWGFNSIRLPMHYNLYTLPIEDEPVAGEQTWLTKGFELTDSLLAWCSANQMYLILDLHAAPGGQGMEAGISDYDPTKPSLWESVENRNKTVALWKKLAERYANEPWMGGYDLINETNWQLPNNAMLRNIYVEITDSIRTVDTNHIIFIEGNWFANDFTNLDNPWDSNMVYSPHKYWNFNDDEGVQWMRDIGNRNNRPVWMGESGENSNTWFTDAIKKMEGINIGWAWWPWKKIDAIAGTISVPKNQGYQDLLDYWSGNGPKPSAGAATAALMQMADWLKIENADIRRDVVDAMFRQINSSDTKPYVNNVAPGVVYGVDYDLGPNGSAYFDLDVATYHVSTGAYTAWNAGWNYRNDGVDIEICEDNINTNGYNIGFIGSGEWLQYEVDVQTGGVYDVMLRVASLNGGGPLHLMIEDADLSSRKTVPGTGSWQGWTSITFNDVVLDQGPQKVRVFADSEGFNFSSLEFLYQGASTSVSTRYLTAKTLDKSEIVLTLNKELQSSSASLNSLFTLTANGNPLSITNVSQDPNNPRNLFFTINEELIFSDLVKISYSGSALTATDGTNLQNFSNQEVQNQIPQIHELPGKIQAEAYFNQVGIQTESTTDTGGGLNIGYTDVGDYMDYSIDITTAGEYLVDYRVAAESENGGVELHLRDDSGWDSVLHRADFQATGGWQTWQTFSQPVDLPKGKYTLRVVITRSLFNMNWFEFTLVNATSIEDELAIDLNLYPNPNQGVFTLKGEMERVGALRLEVFDMMGQSIYEKELALSTLVDEKIDIQNAPRGTYFLRLIDGSGKSISRKIWKE
ncbi:MAG: carbohydrate-binding protein [Bacteroidia bacterium]|nr:carbohydrate-binding protein [Bacteroidia bacterium]